jgi:hypothetical protein
MSRIPKRKSRLITVRGRQFRWLLKGYCRYLGNPYPCPTVTVQVVEDRPGQVLQCHLGNKVIGGPEPDIDGGESRLTTKVTPKDVARIIETGMSQGWDPDEGSTLTPFKV